MMTTDEVQQLVPGIYRIYWEAGGSSLASVGIMLDGERWMAPCNWTGAPVSPDAQARAWAMVDRVQKIDIPPPPPPPQSTCCCGRLRPAAMSEAEIAQFARMWKQLSKGFLDMGVNVPPATDNKEAP